MFTVCTTEVIGGMVSFLVAIAVSEMILQFIWVLLKGAAWPDHVDLCAIDISISSGILSIYKENMDQLITLTFLRSIIVYRYPSIK